MPFDDIAQQTDSIGQLAGMPQSQASGGGQGQGGPGIDTPQEQQAVQMLIQGMQMFRQAATTDPSIRPMIDKILQDGFLQIADHYGYGEEAKLALKQAQMQVGRARASAVEGRGPGQAMPAPAPRPPAPGPSGPPEGPPDMQIRY